MTSVNISALRIDRHTALALVIGLVLYPLLYSNDVFSRLLLPLLPDAWTAPLYSDSGRAEWWYFVAGNFFYHWIPFLAIGWALHKNRESWASVGVDWRWFSTHRVWLLALLLLLVVAALVLPSIYYGGELPARSQAGFVGPVSAVERLAALLVLAFTAAVTEEVIFRGYALTRLTRALPNPWFVLPLVAVSFVFIHGEYRGLGQTLNYVVFSLIFGAFFIVQKFRRLEWLILTHFLINASLVFVP